MSTIFLQYFKSYYYSYFVLYCFSFKIYFSIPHSLSENHMHTRIHDTCSCMQCCVLSLGGVIKTELALYCKHLTLSIPLFQGHLPNVNLQAEMKNRHT